MKQEELEKLLKKSLDIATEIERERLSTMMSIITSLHIALKDTAMEIIKKWEMENKK